MKRFLCVFVLGAVFSLLTDGTYAQLTFFNNTPCTLYVQGAYTNNAASICNPGTYCADPGTPVLPYSTGILPGGLCGGPPGLSYFQTVRFFAAGISYMADICGPASVQFLDCNATVRTVTITSPFTAVAN